MPFEVVLHPRRALRFLRSLPPETRDRIKTALSALEEDPFTPRPGADVKRMTTDDEGIPIYRLRVGDYRCAYGIYEGQVRVFKIFHRSEGYDWMRRLGLD